jgi:purine-binding chemotaxis protein CheW
LADIDTDVTPEVTPPAIEEETVRICLFSVSGDYYAVTVDVLAEIIIPQKIFPIPTTPSHVVGVISLRGNIVPIVDIRPALALPPSSGINHVAIIHANQMIIGVVVDVVSEVIAVPLSSVLPLPAEVTTQDTSAKTRSRYLKAMIRRPEGVAALLNIDRLFEAIAVS